MSRNVENTTGKEWERFVLFVQRFVLFVQRFVLFVQRFVLFVQRFVLFLPTRSLRRCSLFMARSA